MKLSKTRAILFYLALILTNVVIMQDFVIYPITNTLYEIFPDQPAGVNFIISGPAIIMVLTALIAPYLIQKVNRKILLSVVCAVFTVTSIGGCAIPSVPYMVICRAIGGCAYGLVQVTVIDMIASYFVDENQKASFMGIYNTGMSVVGIIMSLIAGNLAVSGWQNTYRAYYIAIPMLLLVLFFVPDFKKSDSGTGENQAGGKEKIKIPMGKTFWIMLADYVVFTICYGGVLTMFVSVYVSENQLGNEAFVGLLTSVSTIGSAVLCIFFGAIYKCLKARSSIIYYAMLILVMVMMAFIPANGTAVAAEFLGGAAYGLLMSYMYSQGTTVINPANAPRAISYISAATGTAMFVTPYIFTALMNAAGSFTAMLPVLAVILLLCTVVEFFNIASMKKLQG